MQIVIAYLYNDNGMATWCIECAKALHANGQQVLLVKSKKIKLPNNFQVPSFDFDMPESASKTFAKKILSRIKDYLQMIPFTSIEHSFLPTLNEKLQEKGIAPSVYLLNQSNLYNSTVTVPQYVVAWAYKPFLKDHLAKVGMFANSLRNRITAIKNAIYWHKADWNAYQHATGVFSVSDKLTEAIASTGLSNVYTVYPGIEKQNEFQIERKNSPTIHFVMMALNVGEKRKRLVWALESMKELKEQFNQFHITVIGECSDDLKKWSKENNLPATFAGKVDREMAMQILQQQDVFLFASALDDWGFVQVEAMSNQLAVLSPDKSPFDEIVGRNDFLFSSDDRQDFLVKIKSILQNSSSIATNKQWFYDRYQQTFSSKAFASSIMAVLN
jgi:glycosyltransferase involved in cell wall biosynthesis